MSATHNIPVTDKVMSAPDKVMSAPDNLVAEYAIIRYVPRIDRHEFVNVGLLMMCKRRKWIRCKLNLDSDRLKALYPGADIAALQRQYSLFERRDVPAKDSPVEECYRWLVAPKSAMLQTSPSHPGIATSESADSLPDDILNDTFERLFKELVL